MDGANCDNFLSAIIASGKASLLELKSRYSLEDAYIIWEAVALASYNDYMQMKQAQERRAAR